MKSWLQDNDIEIYSTNIEEKSVVAERFIRSLKKKNQKTLTSIAKNVFIGNLGGIINKYYNTYHRTIKIECQPHTLIVVQKIIEKSLNLKLMIK